MIALEIAAYCLIGAFSGIFAGLLGLGGGIVAVPCLLVSFRLLGYPQAEWMHLAIGTSLAAMVFNTFSATWAHHRKKAVLWNVIKKMAPGFIVGALIGAWIATSLSGIILQIFFGTFLCVLGVYFFRGKVKTKQGYKLPSLPKLNLMSAGIGAISNILGIGGGTMTVPLLCSYHISDRHAIATSSACSFLLTSLGATSYLVFGWGTVSDTETVGYVNLTAFLVIGIVSFFFAPYGVKLAHELPVEKVRKIFAYVVMITGIFLLFN